MQAQEAKHERLVHWYRTCAQAVSDLPHELSLRQWAILCHVYLVEGEHTVTSLAYTFDVPKPAVTRALDALSALGLIRRRKDERDKRSVVIGKTLEGIKFLHQFDEMLSKVQSSGQVLAGQRMG